MGLCPFSLWFPLPVGQQTFSVDISPTRLRDAWELTLVGELTEAQTAQAELAIHRVRTTATLAARVGANRILRLARSLTLSDVLAISLLLEWEAEVLEQDASFLIVLG